MRITLRALGPLVAPASVSAADWLEAFCGRWPLVLDPASSTGWFSGTAIVAVDPFERGEVECCEHAEMHGIGTALQRAYDAEEPLLTVAELPYDGTATYAIYRGGLVRGPEGWHTWGDFSAEALPELPAPRRVPTPPLVFNASTDLSEEAFSAAVEAVADAVRAGDVYVLNLTRRIHGTTVLSPVQLMRSITERTPALMAAAWQRDERALVSASPERFVRLHAHEVEIAPIKGTRPRGRDAEEDAAFVDDLLGSAKERAEHVMVVDMERNDLGRVCVAGSVRVEPLFAVETTRYCHQAVSSVRGLLRDGAGIGDLLEATFPCGSVTGAPKVAAMRLAEQLEATPRRAYTGSLLVAVPGTLDSSVLIRSLEIDGDHVTYGTGCGITVESDPAEEWRESVLKSEPLLGPMPAQALRETCRVIDGRVPLWTFHRERLRAGGCGEGLLGEVDRIALAAAAHAAGARTRYTRLSVNVTPVGEVTADVTSQPSSLDVEGGPIVARVDVLGEPPLPFRPAKPLDRTWWDDAHRTAADLGAQQAVIVGAGGIVLDGSTAAVWIAENGVAITSLAPPAIPSVSAAFVSAAASSIGLEIRREPISWERFETADEAFLTNAFGGCVPVRGRGGAVCSAVAGLFGQLWG
jgi:para-aminobenzoate synthetase / 4-amino-4-deoxychorismate lyase